MDETGGTMREAVAWALRAGRTHLDALLLLAALAGSVWLLGARGMAGPRRALWLLVPALVAAALVCWLGPGRLFPKVPYEGPQLLVVSRNHALTLLDLPGLACAGVAAAIGGGLLWSKTRPPD
jgi:hypothetical protein